MSLDSFISFSTATTPPQCESPIPNDAEDVSARVIRLSMQKLSNKKHNAQLRNATLIRSLHRQALQQALESAWLDESDCQLDDEDDNVPSEESTMTIDPAEPGSRTQSVWDLVDEWENQGSRKRSEEHMDCDEDDFDEMKRLCYGVELELSEKLPALAWQGEEMLLVA